MRDHEKTREELMEEVAAMRQEMAELKVVMSECEEMNDELSELKRIVEQVGDSVMVTDREGVIEYVNPAFENLTGYEKEEVIGKKPNILKSGKHGKWFYTRLWRIIKSGKDFRATVLNRKKNGTLYYEEKTISPVRNGQGKITNFVSTGRDISERKQAEMTVAEEREFLAVTLRSIGDGVIATDTGGKVILLNKVAEKLTGWTQGEAAGKDVSEVFHILHEKSREPYESPVQRVLKTGQTTEFANHTILISRDGAERVIGDSAAPIKDLNGRTIGIILVFRDLSEKKRMEDERLRASKLESVGILAGGIAHDFNNILTVIMGNLSLARTSASPGGEIFERLQEAEKACIRAKDLTHQLLTFSKGGTPVKKSTSIGELLRDSAFFALSGSNVQCEVSIPEDLWPAEIDEGQINQVMNNLVINAVQAMPEGGVIRIKAERITLEAGKKSHTLPLPDGKYIKISVKDQGVGIPREYLQKVFDPYFTTKQRGTGLGLATTYSIIRNHNGHITVDSTVGVGTTFQIYLPASAHDPQEKKKAEEKPLTGKGKILVMDDEESIRVLAGRILSYFGYQVQLARDGAEALDLYKRAREAGSPFDLVIMDLTIPAGMGGKEAVEKLRELDPDVRAIVSSGYCNDPTMARFKEHGFLGVVSKPYTVRELGKTVHDLLRERSSPGPDAGGNKQPSEKEEESHGE